MTPVEALAEVWQEFDTDQDSCRYLAQADHETEFYEVDAEELITRLRKRGFDVVSGWQPIEIFPEENDGLWVDLWWREPDEDGYRCPECRWRDDDTFIDMSGNIIETRYITHWRLPFDAPVSVGEKA